MDETSYPKKEVVLVDKGSTDPETVSMYDRWMASGIIRLVPCDLPITDPAARNAGADVANGEFILFLDDDLRLESADWLEELIRWAQRPGIGIVGPKILQRNGTVKHAGIAVSLDSYVSMYQDQEPDHWNILGHVDPYRNLSALHGACHLISLSTYTRLGRYDERHLGAYGDINICLKASRSGLRNLYTPYAVLIHDPSNGSEQVGDPSDDVDLAAREIISNGVLRGPLFPPFAPAPCDECNASPWS
jgi:glycosyltransferase involved in cell wall biosynthesis